MRYYATPSSEETVDAMVAGRLGLIDTPLQGSAARIARAHVGGVAWCADNGAFSDKWTEGRWWSWLTADRQLVNVDRCAFATAPDVVADPVATLERSRPWLPRIRGLGYPVAFVAQNRSTGLIPWGEVDVLFLGGTLECLPCSYVHPRGGGRPQDREPCPRCGARMTEWKLGGEAQALTRDAVAREVPVHMGRVNSETRFERARIMGCSSADGTFLVGRTRRLGELLRWTRVTDQPFLV